jgi:inhibitor of KinA sporulation pathway (predicted exonuclease)
VVFDLEWTSWEGAAGRGWSGPGEFQEIVQIGAVRLDGSSLAERAAFEILVRPSLNPTLSRYFTDLTGIRQEDVDRAGLPFPDAARRFASFVGRDATGLYFNGADGLVFSANCGLHRMSSPLGETLFFNLRPFIVECLGIAEPFVSAELPARLGQPPAGAAHQGLADARAVAGALRRLAEEEAGGPQSLEGGAGFTPCR